MLLAAPLCLELFELHDVVDPPVEEGAVYGSTLLAWLDDQSEDWGETAAFLDRRLADVMRFEKWKASWTGNDLYRPSLTQFLGRLRYPAR